MLMLMAMVAELCLGWPPSLFAAIRHPVVWIGWMINRLERLLNREGSLPLARQLLGMLTALLVVIVTTLVALLLVWLLPDTLAGFMLEALIASSLLATRSLYAHVAAVSRPLLRADVSEARSALSLIVGRRTADLQESGIAGAALESLAENASDGVVAPLFWGVLFGLPGLAAYKAINTLDSMIGHKSTRYLDFGRFSAKLDDVVNWLPARLSALLIWLAGGRVCSFRSLAMQARHHRSPNAGWPESAMAFALKIKLSGPRVYEEGISEEPWLNAEGASPGAPELHQGLLVYAYAMVWMLVLLVLLAWLDLGY
ncbi:adenosylcobinamide-phosphate synthase CbiB [Granulosicoccus antarcticus]|uniref:Cobalamin biosynthesis protein CobD n=1 Tax=Granulosicoccus antarcticus IMCC3135 TaxID=1192854 RepID=A0A2Z2NKA0_9GAMM|nr:adenosylcobinamide-phosphate synthase CbiB [Granulosicoccus antarcticus]ASJ71822.1 Cobalamin biosynthesis protein CobD [Granulosicoccus antarcticus IMCC3135]